MAVKTTSEIIFQKYQTEYPSWEKAPEKTSTAVAFFSLSHLYTFCRDEREWADRVRAVNISGCRLQSEALKKIAASLPKVKKVFFSSLDINFPQEPFCDYVYSPKESVLGGIRYETPQELINKLLQIPESVRRSIVSLRPFFYNSVHVSKDDIARIVELFPKLTSFALTAGVIESISPLLKLGALETLRISASSLEETPDFQDHPTIREIFLDGHMPQQLPAFSRCPNLVLVNIKSVKVSAPLLFEDLPQLESAKVHFSEVSRITFNGCPQVNTLEVEYCQNLEHIEGLDQLSGLKKLTLTECLNKQEYTLDVSLFPELGTLYLSCSKAITGVIGTIKDSEKIASIWISHCPNVTVIPEIVNTPNLRMFRVMDCSDTLQVRIKKCETLKCLTLCGIQQFRGECWVEECPNLTEFSTSAGKPHARKEPQEQVEGTLLIRNLKNVGKLQFCGVWQDQLALSVEGCPKVYDFTLMDCKIPFGKMRLLQPERKMQSIEFNECGGSFNGFSNFNQGKTGLDLTFIECQTLPDFSEMAGNNIVSVKIDSSEECVGDLNFTNLAQLSSVTLENLPQADAVAFSEKNTSLSEITLEDLPQCRSIDGLDTLNALVKVSLKRTAIQELPSFRDRKKLRTVQIIDHQELVRMGDFTDCYELSDVELLNCQHLRLPPSFTNCVGLQKVSLPHSDGVTHLPAFTNCPSLFEDRYPREYREGACTVQDLTQSSGVSISELDDDVYCAVIKRKFIDFARGKRFTRTSCAPFKGCVNIRLSKVSDRDDFVKLTASLKDGRQTVYFIDTKERFCYTYLPQGIKEGEARRKISLTDLKGIEISHAAYNRHGVALVGKRGDQTVFFWGSPQDRRLKEISPVKDEGEMVYDEDGVIHYFFFQMRTPVINCKVAYPLKDLGQDP